MLKGGSMTKIEWCERTWNPIRASRKTDGKVGWFCTHVSTACLRCYAEQQNIVGGKNPGRFGNGVRYAVDQRKLVDIYLDEKTLTEPLHWKTGQKIFPCSMSDLYGEWVPDAWLERIYAVMAATPQHFYIVLTKRSGRRLSYLSSHGARLPNVIEMASFGRQEDADTEVPLLLQTPAAQRGVSAEPLLEQVDLTKYLAHLQWVIVGGESGGQARPFALEWGMSLIEQCERAGCAVFVKQVGSRPIDIKTHNRKGGDMNEWPKALRVRQWPKGIIKRKRVAA